MDKAKLSKFFYRMLCGAFLGISVIAPGISGSIMAVMMGIYDDLINIISNPFKNLKSNIIYVFPMVIGAGISMILLLRALNFLFANYTIPAYLLFMSLIVGSVPTVIDEAKKGVIKKKYFIGTVIAFLFAVTIGFLAKSDFAFSFNFETVTSTAMRIYMPVCGAISGMMSMVPGMSISMLLMMFGIYEPLLVLANDIMDTSLWFGSAWFTNVFIVAMVGVAFVIGMMLFSNITKIVFKKHHSLGFLMVFGFMSGSVVSVFPGLPVGFTNWLLSFICIAIGLSVSYLFKVLGKRLNID